MRKRFLLLIVLFVLDRSIKNIVWFSLGSSSEVFFRPILNANIAFSFSIPGVSASLLVVLLTLIVLAFSIVSARLYIQKRDDFVWWSLITIGALSNVLDRYILGGVLDYVDLGWFPVFNLSDVYISVAVIYLLYRELARSHFSRLHGAKA